MSSFRSALLLIAAVATSYGAESLAEIARWPDLVAQAKDFGVDYPAVVGRAEHGDTKSVHTVFSVTSHTDGSGATSHAAVLRRLLERLGDRKFSGVLRTEPRNLRDLVIHQIDFDFARPWKNAFPITYELGSHDTSLLRGQ